MRSKNVEQIHFFNLPLRFFLTVNTMLFEKMTYVHQNLSWRLDLKITSPPLRICSVILRVRNSLVIFIEIQLFQNNHCPSECLQTIKLTPIQIRIYAKKIVVLITPFSIEATFAIISVRILDFFYRFVIIVMFCTNSLCFISASYSLITFACHTY